MAAWSIPVLYVPVSLLTALHACSPVGAGLTRVTTVQLPMPRPSHWLIMSAAVEGSALLALVAVFMFLWARVEAAQREQPSVLLLGAERAAAAGRVSLSVRLSALHALLCESHSSPLLFRLVPASAAFNLLVGATSVGTFMEMSSVASRYLSWSCNTEEAAVAAGVYDGDASPGGTGDVPLVDHVLVPFIDVTIALVSRGLGWGE